MATTYFGFALADSMFGESAEVIHRRSVSADEVRKLAPSVTPCLNPSHEATIAAMRERFGINIPIPPSPPKISLGHGDSVLVMGVRGLPRLTDRHEYTPAEIDSATFTFTEYSVE